MKLGPELRGPVGFSPYDRPDIGLANDYDTVVDLVNVTIEHVLSLLVESVGSDDVVKR